MAVIVNEERYTGCGECAAVCPVEAIVIAEKKAQVKEEECVECGACAEGCPEKAISLP